jgi:enoyl-CoA hydratase
MSYKNVLTGQAGGLATVTVNRPEVLNALNAETIAELTELFHDLKEDKTVKGVIVTGAGEKAFVAGADIGELAKMTPAEAKRTSEDGQHLFNLIETLGKPVAAAVNGFALGGGLELAMSCSFRYAAEGAKVGQPEIKLGLIPGYGGTQRLSRLVGKGRAMEMLLTGDMIGAEEACSMGLVNRVLPPEELMPALEKVMGKIVKKSPLIIRYLMQAVNNGLCMTLKDGLALEANLFSMCADSDDMHEGTDAFLNKRKPEFKGC